MSDSPNIIHKSGYRKWSHDTNSWQPIPGISRDSLSPEEQVLEALRDRFEDLGTLFHSIGHEKGMVGGEGKLYLHVVNGKLINFSRSEFTTKLGIPKEQIGRYSVNSYDPDRSRHDVYIALPEKETCVALGIASPGRSPG